MAKTTYLCEKCNQPQEIEQWVVKNVLHGILPKFCKKCRYNGKSNTNKAS